MDQVEKWNSSLVPVQQPSIPELTEFQMNTLTDAGESEQGLVLLARPNDEDPPEIADVWNNSNAEMDELIAMGLLMDITENFRQQIENSKSNHNRAFRVFAVTPIGKAMFDVTTDPSAPVN